MMLKTTVNNIIFQSSEKKGITTYRCGYRRARYRLTNTFHARFKGPKEEKNYRKNEIGDIDAVHLKI